MALPLTPCAYTQPRGETRFFWVLSASPVCQSIRLSRLCSENALSSNPSSASSLLCDLRKRFCLSELSFIR